MLLKLFKGITPEAIFFNLVILTAIWVSPFINPQHASFYFDVRPMPLYALLKSFASSTSTGTVINFSILLIISFLLVHFNTVLYFIPERTCLPSVLFALFSGFFVQYQSLNPVIPASVFMILALNRIIDSYRKNGTAFSFFDASLMIGIGSLFYANLIWFGFILIPGVIILRGYNLKELIISVIGLFVPFIITAEIYYILSYDLQNLVEDIKYNLFTETGSYYFSIAETAGIIIAGFLVLTGIIFLFPRIKNIKIRSRKIFILLLWWFLISLVLYFVSPCASVELVYLVAMPAAYFITYYLVFSKANILKEVMFLALVLATASIQIIEYLHLNQ